MTDENSTAPVEVGSTKAGIQVDEGSAALTDYIEHQALSFREALERYDPVQVVHDPVNGSYMVMAERDPGMSAVSAFEEIGYVSPSPFTSWTRQEHNPKLRDKQGLTEYYRMKRADGMVRGILRMLKTPIQAGRWFVEPASDSARDKKIAEFVSDNLFEYLNVTWSKLLDDILLCCDYGFMVMEKVFRYNDEGQIVLQKLAPRHPLDIQEWIYDRKGGPDGVVMEPNIIDGSIATPPEKRFIPISKLAVFVLESEAGDLNGISALRSIYKHYYYKDNLYKIDAIQKERHGIGVPIIKLPVGYSEADKRVAENLGRNLRTNDRGHVVLPPQWEILFAKLEGQPVDCLPSIAHHNEMIKLNILAPFMNDSSVDAESTDLFMKSTRYIGNTVADVFNKHVIPQLVNFNFRLGSTRKYPMLRVRRVGEWEDIRTMSFAFRNLVGSGAIIPDDVLEKFFRRELDLPPMDKATSRVLPTAPQEGPGGENGSPSAPKPPQVGGPRQAKPKATSGQPNSGIDRSGG